MKINGVSTNVAFNGWRKSSKVNDIHTIAEYYENIRARQGVNYDFNDLAGIYHWLDKNTPDFDIYIAPQYGKEIGLLTALSKKNPREIYQYSIDETEKNNSMLAGFTRMRARMDFVNRSNQAK